MNTFDFIVIGGDARLSYMASLLKEKGYSVNTYCTCTPKEFPCADSLKDALHSAKVIICPIPFSRNTKDILTLPDNVSGDSDISISVFKESLNSGQLLFAGCIPPDVLSYGNENNIFMYDYMKNEALTLYNTIATAEGAISEAIKYQPTNLHSGKCIVLGFGRCARTLALKLNGLSADVTVCARKEEALAEADAMGYRTLPLPYIKDKINSYEYIFNTIPSIVLDETHMSLIRKDALIIDIAPGGFDFELSRSMGLNSYLSLGLPGKYAPKSSALILTDVTLSVLRTQTDSLNEDTVNIGT